METALGGLAEQRARHRKALTDLAELREAHEAERAAEARRGLVVEHDRAVRSLEAELAGLAEPEAAAA
jgi:hypothetical protein